MKNPNMIDDNNEWKNDYLIWYSEPDGNLSGIQYRAFCESDALALFERDFAGENLSVFDIENVNPTSTEGVEGVNYG